MTQANPFNEMDLSTPARSVGPARAAGTAPGIIADALDAVPGLSLRCVTLAGAGSMLRAIVTCTGWSPTLHSIPVETIVTVHDGRMETALAALMPSFERQRRRSTDAGLLGIDMPIRDGFDVMDHIWIDRTLLEINRRADLPPLRRRLATTNDAIHRSGKAHDGGTYHVNAAGMLGEIDAGMETPRTRMIGGAVQFRPDGTIDLRRQAGADLPTFDGALLTVPSKPLPETALRAMAGMTVGDLVRLHPLMDGRRIQQVRNSADGTRVVAAIERDLVAVSTLR